MTWNIISYIIASKTRKSIVLKLVIPRTPTFLAKNLKINLANISRALTELEEKEIIMCLTPDQRVGKIYSLTEKGKEIISTIKTIESENRSQVKIQYKFRNDKTTYTCHVTFEQYENLQILPIMEYCDIITINQNGKKR